MVKHPCRAPNQKPGADKRWHKARRAERRALEQVAHKIGYALAQILRRQIDDRFLNVCLAQDAAGDGDSQHQNGRQRENSVVGQGSSKDRSLV